MSPQESLSQLAADLSAWRSSCVDKSAKIPLDFVRRAYDLKKVLKQSDIERATKIYKYQYKRLASPSNPAVSSGLITASRIDVLAPNSLSIELSGGIRLDCHVAGPNFAEVLTSVVKSLHQAGMGAAT
jgi:hypothetical protein